MVHGCMVYTERAETAAVSCGTSHDSAVSTPLRWTDSKTRCKKIVTHVAETAAVSRGTSHVSALSTPLRWLFKYAL